jgi:lipoate-protein ligase A
VLFSELVRLIDPDPHPAPFNMAIDEALLRHAEVPSLRIYRWSEPAVSFGYFGKLAAAQEAAAGRALVRRWTGGGLVEHGADLTYTLVVPREHAFCRHNTSESYRLIHEVIAQSLTSRAISAELLPDERTPVSGACFVSPVRYDLISAGRKVAGAAQRRTRWGLLHQGSIQITGDDGHFRENLADDFSDEVTSIHLPPHIQTAAEALTNLKYGTPAWLEKF